MIDFESMTDREKLEYVYGQMVADAAKMRERLESEECRKSETTCAWVRGYEVAAGSHADLLRDLLDLEQ